MRKVLHNFRWWENHEPQTMRVEGDQVVARDSRTDLNWEGADRMDCLGKVLRPGFIDCHCHILPMGLDIQKLNLEGIEDRGELLDRIRDRHRSQPDGWLHAVHYDQNRLAGGHLTRAELDAISVDRPILIRHVNGHASVANSQALASAGVDETVIDPKGGEFVRDAEGRLTGVLLETAHERVTNQMPLPTLEEMTEAILAAGHRMREWGITAASDMMTGRFDLKLELEAYRAARRRGMPIRVRLYVQWSSVFGKRAGNFEDTVSWFTSDDQDWVRVAGIKLFADGAIGSATAAVYEPYTGGGKGHLIYSPEELSRRVLIAHNSGFAVATHTIGDRATDVILDALEATGEPSRHRIEHAMILSDQQIERIVRNGCGLTFQPEFLGQFGHAYQRQLGPDRAAKLKRTRSVLDAGIPLAFSSDLPIVNGNPEDGMRYAVSRPVGFDPSEACTTDEAFRAYTETAAWINRDGDTMGQLKPGYLADYNLV